MVLVSPRLKLGCIVSGFIFFVCLPFSARAIPQPIIENISVAAKNRARVDILLRQRTRNRRAKLVILQSLDDQQYATLRRVQLKKFRKKRKFSVIVPLSRDGNVFFRSRVVLPNGRTGPISESQELLVAEDEVETKDLWPPLFAGFKECPASFEGDALLEVNRVRKSYGLKTLTEDYYLLVAARRHTLHMAKNNVLSHDGWFDEILALGLTATHYSQNVAYTYRSGKGVVDAWMNSPSHAQNILNAKDSKVGIACIQDASGNFWWSQNFSN